MNKVLLSFLLMLLPRLANGYDAKVDGVYYNLKSGNVAEVTSYGFYGNSGYSGEVNIPEKFIYEGVQYSVTSIGENAFEDSSDLISVAIPNSVTSIGKCAFYGCTGLTSVTIPNSVTIIESYAFCGCIGLTSVTIPNSVTAIERWAFGGCTGLTSVHITDLEAWCKISFGQNPFSACHLYLNEEEIWDLNIPNTITSIRAWAFHGFNSLISVNIPNSVSAIGHDAFSDCCNLTSVTIHNSVTCIENNAFYGCTSLASMTIPKSVTTIGYFAFAGCSLLLSVTIPKSLTAIGEGAFKDCGILTSITIPQYVTYIGEKAFSGCASLTSVISKMENPCPVDIGCFDDDVYNNSTLYVPNKSIDKYKSTDYWSKILHIEEGIPSGMETINRAEDGSSHELDRYDVRGNRLDTPQKGLNIIRMSDGTTKKVYKL